MKQLQISVPYEGAVVQGALFADQDGTDLDQDVLQIALPNGLFIDVGWYPCNDPNGRFKIVTYRESYRTPVRPNEYTANPYRVLSIVSEIAEELLAKENAKRIATNRFHQVKVTDGTSTHNPSRKSSATSHTSLRVKDLTSSLVTV